MANKVDERESYIACCDEMAKNILNYFLLLAKCPYEEHTKKDRKMIKGVYWHIKRCETCDNGHKYLKTVFDNGRNLPPGDAFFSLDEMRIIKRNERVLEEII